MSRGLGDEIERQTQENKYLLTQLIQLYERESIPEEEEDEEEDDGLWISREATENKIKRKRQFCNLSQELKHFWTIKVPNANSNSTLWNQI